MLGSLLLRLLLDRLRRLRPRSPLVVMVIVIVIVIVIIIVIVIVIVIVIGILIGIGIVIDYSHPLGHPRTLRELATRSTSLPLV